MENLTDGQKEVLHGKARDMVNKKLGACNTAISAMQGAGYNHGRHVYTMLVNEQLRLMSLSNKANTQWIKPEDV